MSKLPLRPRLGARRPLPLLACLALALALALLSGAGARAVPLGPAPDFTLEDQDGNVVALADFAGTGVILDFCTVWCAVCQDFYELTYPTLAGNALVVPLLFQDVSGQTSDAADAQLWANAFGVDTLHLGGDAAAELDLLSAYFAGQSVLAVPTFVFVSADLEIIDFLEGAPITPALVENQWEPRLDALLATQSAPSPSASALLAGALAGLGWIGRRRR